MQVFRTIEETLKELASAGSRGGLGLVPTMGALHEGHISLVRRACSENEDVVASIFVNPLQFGPHEDLAKYPRTFSDDCHQLEREGVQFLFAPEPEEMYRRGATTTIDVGPVGGRLDGASRPGHFVGVATVVAKLFHIAQPDRAYFGQKDAAQLAVIRQMVCDLNFPVDVIACPIVRDCDGLALSSRNRYLSEAERRTALILPHTLATIEERICAGVRESAVLLGPNAALDGAPPEFTLDYLVLVDRDTLLPVPEALPGTLIAIAARVGQTKLIDNLIVA